MGIFIYAFTATGKSSVSKKYSNVIDMESTLYKYLDVEKEEIIKNLLIGIPNYGKNGY